MTKAARILAVSILLLVLPSCLPSVAQDQAIEPKLTCEDLSHGRYCFESEYVFSSGDDGFLLFVPMPVTDVTCNKSREGWPEERILFGDYRMPDRVYPLSGEAARGVIRRVIAPDEHLFKASEYEIETCKSDLLIAGTHCKIDSHWNGMRVAIDYWKGCGGLKYKFASDVEQILNEARHTAND